MMDMAYNRKIVLEDGGEYYGFGFGAKCDAVLELVFNTSMVGYQEILSDPSYTDQAVVMTYPLIGNYGMAADDNERAIPSIGALIVREYNDEPSNFRSKESLADYMKSYIIPGVSGVDTRKLTRAIRDGGSRKCLITSADKSREECLAMLSAEELGRDAVAYVSCKKSWCSKAQESKYHVVVIDCGMKLNIVRSLNTRGCDVTIVPWNTPVRDIRKLKPDGIVISNGPGDPADVWPVIDTVSALRRKYPMFGICLGHQIIALSYGAKTYKLKFGHRGGNHPVKNLKTGKIEISSQNHSYAVDEKSLEGTGLVCTHINLLDNTVEGMECGAERVFSVQYHPESAPGPQDSAYLFDRFIKLMEDAKQNA